MKLSVITLTYNKLEYTKKFVESLFKYTNDFELIVVDNGSTDGTVEYLKSLTGVKTLFNNENLGYSKANNQGIELATGEYIGFLNNDILLSPNWFEECEKVFHTEKVGFISPREINPYYDKADEKTYIKYFEGLKFKDNYKKDFDDCVFSCVLAKKEVLIEIGKFDENYTPAFYEDNDYKYRAIQAGYGVYVCNNACFYHFGSITSINHNENFEKNRQYFYSKYPFAEYLAHSGEERRKLQRVKKQLNIFPMNFVFGMYLFVEKVVNRIKKVFRKR